MRWLAVVVLAPLLSLGSFLGPQFVAHSHGDHGTHLHPASLLRGAELVAEIHADHHGHDHEVAHRPADSSDGSPCGEESDEVPDCVIVAIDLEKSLSSRAAGFDKTLLPAAIFVMAAVVMPPSQDLDYHTGSPGGLGVGGPLDHVALTASDRLVRTSLALLI